jgi:filamentous hemagglutinin family protein
MKRADHPMRSAAAGIMACALFAPSAHALAPGTLPTGGTVTAGAGTIASSGSAMTIQQTSPRMAIDWSSFSIGANASVTFDQPGPGAIALNRVLGSAKSEIYGKLNANGQVFLLNPNGILFGKGAEVNVGGLVASTLSLSNDDFMAGRSRFAGRAGAVDNEGSLNGGYVALLGGQVSNRGTVSARLGTAVLAAGSDITLDFAGDGLIGVSVDQGALNALVENKHLIQADGGTVILTAKAADRLIRAVVNNTGVIEARRVEKHAGVIKLLGDMENGIVEVGGTLDASAANGGGGFIETSAARVKIADDAFITTKAANGNNGAWLIDPDDFTIAASGGSITGAALSNALLTNNVTIQTTSGGVGCINAPCTSGTSGNGDIFVNDTVTWSSHVLTLNAWRNIVFNASLNGSGAAGLALVYGQKAVASGNTATYSLNNGAKINLASTGSFSTKLGSNGAVDNYTIITTLGEAGSMTGTDLQGMQGGLAGKYVLGSDIDATSTATWNPDGSGGYYSFSQIGSSADFTGTFDGLGHTITGLTINRPTENYVGLFGRNAGTLRNVGLTDVNITARTGAGGLAGLNNGYISDSYAIGTVSSVGPTSSAGGLVGISGNGGYGISNSYASGSVSGTGNVGGLIGMDSNGPVVNSYYDVDVTTINGAHRLTLHGIYDAQYQAWRTNGNKVDIANYLTQDAGGYYQVSTQQHLKDVLAFTANPAYKFRLTADVDLTALPGWHIPILAGQFDGNNHVVDHLNVSNSWNPVGFIGILKSTGAVNNLGVANATVSGGKSVGGLIGQMNGGSIGNSYVTGAISGTSFTGGLAGSGAGTITNSYASGTVSASVGSYFGGLVGRSSATITNSYANVTVAGGGSYLGGVAGWNTGTISSTTFWNSSLTATGVAGGIVSGPTALTTTQMKSWDNFNNAGWSIANAGGSSAVWRIYEGQTTPLLRSFLTPLTVSPTSGSRQYDGTTDNLGLTHSATPTANLLGSVTATGGGRNVGTYALGLSGTYWSNQQGFDVSYVGTGAMTVTPRPVTLAGSRTYDGSNAIAAASLSVTNLIAGDTLTLSGSGVLAGKNAGLQALAGPGTLAVDNGNYTTTGASGSATIGKATLDLYAVTDSKNYDGGTSSAATPTHAGLQTGDSLTGLSQSYASKNALGADNSTLNVNGGYALADGNGGNNYNVVAHTATGTITPRAVTLSGSRLYDGTSAIASASLSVTNLVAGDTLTLSGSGILASRNVGTQALAGPGTLAVDNGNYTTIGASGSVTIGKATLDLYAATDSKTYDGGTSSAAAPTHTGLQTGDSLTGLSQSYASKNALGANNSMLNVDGGFTLADGNGGSNYNVVAHSAAGTISPRAVTLAGSRAYDGTTIIAASDLSVTNLVAGDTASLSGSGTLANKNVGGEAIVGFGSLAVSNANYTMSGASGWVTVTAVPEPPPAGGQEHNGSRSLEAGTADLRPVMASVHVQTNEARVSQAPTAGQIGEAVIKRSGHAGLIQIVFPGINLPAWLVSDREMDAYIASR